MSALVTVAFLCNDEHGNDTGRCEAVHFVSEEHGDVDLCCQMPRGQVFRVSHPVSSDCHMRCIRLGRRLYTGHGWRSMYGNVFWEATGMTLPEAERLLRCLLGCGYTVEGYDEGTLSKIIDEHESRAGSGASTLPPHGAKG